MFITYEHQERNKAFDRLIDETSQVLTAPAVQQRLGGMAVKLQDRLDDAVLPNYRFNTLSLPIEYADTEHFAVMPVASGEDMHEMIIDPSLIIPPPRRLELIVGQMAAAGKDTKAAYAFVVETTRAVSGKKIPELKSTTLARLSRYSLSDTETRAFFMSRPVVLSRITEQDSILGIGSRMAHELTHVHQSDALTEEPVDATAQLASHELEAYWTEYEIIMALTAHPIFDTDMSLSATSLVVEGWRKRLTHPDRPYEATPAVVRKMREYKLLDPRSTDVAA